MLFSRWNVIILITSAIIIHETHCGKYRRINKNIKFVIQDAIESIDVSERDNNQLCANQTIHLEDAFDNVEIWAIKVADSWGKLPSGILSGNLFEFGNFEQCLASGHDSDIVDKKFKPQYCIAKIEINSTNTKPKSDLLSAIDDDLLSKLAIYGLQSLWLGTCFPDSCSPEFLTALVNAVLQKMSTIDVLNVTFSDEFCQTTTKLDYGRSDIFAICFFSAIVAIMILSTAYDLVMKHQNKTRNAMICAFSVYTNGEKLFKCVRSESPDIIDCLHGIRFLSIVWVVFAHTYSMYLEYSANLIDLTTWITKPYSMLIVGSTVSADTFFLLSGLLVTLNMLKHFDANNGKLNNIPRIYLHRYLRLTPALSAAVLLFSTIFRHLGSGPLWKSIDPLQNCAPYGWSTVLYVQNYVNPANSCLGPTWYLQVDMQLYILSPLIIYPLWRWRNKFVWTIPVLILLSMGSLFTLFMVNHFKTARMAGGDEPGNYEKTFVPTHVRFGAWGIGVLLGYILYGNKSKRVVLSKEFICCGWITSIGTILLLIFGLYPMNQPGAISSDFENAAYEALSRICWAISVAWIVFACINGYAGPVNWFLSLPHWQPLSRLTYSIFLLHFIVQSVQFGSIRTATYFTDYNAIHKFWGDFGLTMCAAVFWTLAFESPILVLEKLQLPGRKSSSDVDKVEDQRENMSLADTNKKNGEAVE